MSELGKYQLPRGWAWATIPELVGESGVFVDGDWVETVDQDPDGCVRLIQLADVGDGIYRDKSARFMTKAKAERLRCTFLKKGDVLIARMPDPLGRACIFPGDAKPSVTVVDVAIVRSHNGEFDHRWLACFVNAQAFRAAVSGLEAGSTRKRISRGNLATIPLPVPPLAEQQRIVLETEKHFSRLDVGVAALLRVRSNLARYGAAVLKAACEGRLVGTAVTPRKTGNRQSTPETGEDILTRILSERRERWNGEGEYKEAVTPDTTTLPRLPDGWVWATVGQLSVFSRYGPRFSSDDYAEDGYVVLRTSDISESGRVDSAKAPRLPLSKEEFQRYRAQRGDLLVTRTGSLGTLAIFDDDVDAIPGAYLIQFRLATEPITTRYLFYFLKSPVGQSYLARKGAGVGRPNLNAPTIEALAVPLPPLADQRLIVAEVERRLSVVEELQAVVQANLLRATRLRKSILQKAFLGEVVPQESIERSTNLIALSAGKRNRRPNTHFARAVLSAEIVHRLHREPTFGRVKHQKIFHLCEHIAEIEEIQGQYHREAAGPLDNNLIYANEAELKKQRWYAEVPRESHGHAYDPLDRAGGHRKYLEDFWSDKIPLVERLIELMRSWNTDQCEIFSTTYAAWNDLIIWGKPPTDAAILHEILERWHRRKRRFPEARWRNAIGWMKKEGFVPTGFGTSTTATTKST